MSLYEVCARFLDMAKWASEQEEYFDAKQNAVYGLAVVAKALPAAQFASLLPKCLEVVELYLTQNQTEEALPVFENTIITLGTLAVMQSKDEAQVTKFMQSLPLKGEEEAREAHDLLLQGVVNGEACLVSNANLKETVQRIHAAAEANHELLSEDGKANLAKVLAM